MTITYDPTIVDQRTVATNVIEQVKKAGYEIPTATVELPLIGMTCANCANTIEQSLNKVAGVLDASVNFANEKTTITYAPGTVNKSDMIAAVRQAGYDVIEIEGDEELEDAEAAAREAEYSYQKRRLIIGATFTIPLVALTMLRDFGFLEAWADAGWVNWLFLALAIPVQFYVGKDYYTGAYKSLRNGSANMDVLVATGTTVAYFYSLAVLIAMTFFDAVTTTGNRWKYGVPIGRNALFLTAVAMLHWV